VTEETVTGLGNYVEGEIEDQMTEAGFDFIAEAITNIRETMFPNMTKEEV